MKLLITWLGLLFALPALGQQTHFNIDRGEETWAFDMAWTNAKQKARSAQFELDAGSIQADVDTPLMFQKNEAHEVIIAAVRKYTKTLKGVDITGQTEAELMGVMQQEDCARSSLGRRKWTCGGMWCII